MKKLITVYMVVIFAAVVSCNKRIENRKIPAKVTSTFNEMFYGVNDVHWNKVDNIVYKADFSEKGKKVTVLFSLDGIWQKTTRQIDPKGLPPAVWKAINKSFKNYSITYVASVKNMIGMEYIVDLKRKGPGIELTYDLNGDLMNQITK